MSMRQLKITKSITNRESQSLEKYLQEIGKVELITPEEEVKLAVRIKWRPGGAGEINQGEFAFCSFCSKTVSEPGTNASGSDQ